MKPIRTVERYVTSDGKEHQTEDTAKYHQLCIEFQEAIENDPDRPDESPDYLVVWVSNNRTKILEFITETNKIFVEQESKI